MSCLKAALFDLDGTLFDTETQYSKFWKCMGEIYIPHIHDFHKLIKGTTLDSIFNTYFPNDIDRKIITQKLDEWEYNMSYKFVDGAHDFVSQLNQLGVKCAVVTSSNQKKVECVRRTNADLDILFNDIITSEMVLRSKPFPDCFYLAAKKMQVAADECVVFEDSINGLRAAKNANMFTIGLATTINKDILMKFCDFFINDFTEISYSLLIDLFNHNNIL